jgi:hypothetical protein
LKDEIENKIQLKKWVESTGLTHNPSYKTVITP